MIRLSVCDINVKRCDGGSFSPHHHISTPSSSPLTQARGIWPRKSPFTAPECQKESIQARMHGLLILSYPVCLFPRQPSHVLSHHVLFLNQSARLICTLQCFSGEPAVLRCASPTRLTSLNSEATEARAGQWAASQGSSHPQTCILHIDFTIQISEVQNPSFQSPTLHIYNQLHTS